MKTYDDSHWVTDRLVDGSTDFDMMNNIASDLGEAKAVITELYAHYLTSGTKVSTRESVDGILTDVFTSPINSSDEGGRGFVKAQVQSMYAVALAAENLVRFASEATSAMLADIDENGFDRE